MSRASSCRRARPVERPPRAGRPRQRGSVGGRPGRRRSPRSPRRALGDVPPTSCVGEPPPDEVRVPLRGARPPTRSRSGAPTCSAALVEVSVEHTGLCVAGPPRSGRTTTLRHVARSLVAARVRGVDRRPRRRHRRTRSPRVGQGPTRRSSCSRSSPRCASRCPRRGRTCSSSTTSTATSQSALRPTRTTASSSPRRAA